MIKRVLFLTILATALAVAQTTTPPPVASPGPACLPNTGNLHTAVNPSSGNTVVSLWCDVAAGTYHYSASGNVANGSACLAGVEPFNVSTTWLQHAWAACVTTPMSPSDQTFADQLSYTWVPRPTVKGTGPQTIFTTASNGGLGSPLILGTPQVFQTIAGGTQTGGQRIPGGNVTRFCDVSGLTSVQGNVIPAGSYAACSLVFPPAAGFQYQASADKSTIVAPTNAVIVDAAHHVWGIDAKGVITIDGVEDPLTSNVVELAYVGGLVWQQNKTPLWWSKVSPTAPWLPQAGTATPPL